MSDETKPKITKGGIIIPDNVLMNELDDEDAKLVVTRVRVFNGLTMETPFYVGLLRGKSRVGRLTNNNEAHALWHYFCVASNAYRRHKEAKVYEGEADPAFAAEQIFRSLAQAHGVRPEAMSRFWPMIEQQRWALGLSLNADLPERYKFRSH